MLNYCPYPKKKKERKKTDLEADIGSAIDETIPAQSANKVQTLYICNWSIRAVVCFSENGVFIL